MNNDLILLDEVMSFKSKDDIKERRFFWLYPFTNENIKAYYKYIDFKDKSVLCVTSSGDHALNAILNDAKNISSFDINPLAKYFSELKIAAIKSLPLEEFIMFFYNKKLTTYKYFLDKKIYNKFTNNLSGEYKDFWDYFFNKYTKKEIFKSYLISDDYLDIKALLEVDSYLNEENYYKLREKLNDIKINYYDINITDLKALNKKFDIILFSNIPAFLKDTNDIDILERFKNIINYIKKDNSQVIVNYYYDNLLFYSKEIIYDYKKVVEYFTEKEYEYIDFESAYNIQTRKKYGFSGNNKDLVLLTKNKK